MKSNDKWTVAFDHDQDVGIWGAVVLDLPGCTSGGNSLSEAKANVAEAIAVHLSELAHADDTVPIPQGVDALLALAERDRELQEAMTGSILLEINAAEIRSRAARVQITMSAALLDQVDKEAARIDMNRSAYLAQAARAYLSATA